MSRVLFAGDLHLGHKNIQKFRTEFDSEEDHETTILSNFLVSVTRRDILYLTGDIAFNEEKLELLKLIPGRKILVKGNHDEFSLAAASGVFEQIHGITRYKYAWVSHCPMHPSELYGKINIHGHVHRKTIEDERYVNVSLENIGYHPIDYRAIMYYRRKRAEGVDIELQDHLEYPISEF